VANGNGKPWISIKPPFHSFSSSIYRRGNDSGLLPGWSDATSWGMISLTQCCITTLPFDSFIFWNIATVLLLCLQVFPRVTGFQIFMKFPIRVLKYKRFRSKRELYSFFSDKRESIENGENLYLTLL
jgi:hypothetical protein